MFPSETSARVPPGEHRGPRSDSSLLPAPARGPPVMAAPVAVGTPRQEPRSSACFLLCTENQIILQPLIMWLCFMWIPDLVADLVQELRHSWLPVPGSNLRPESNLPSAISLKLFAIGYVDHKNTVQCTMRETSQDSGKEKAQPGQLKHLGGKSTGCF